MNRTNRSFHLDVALQERIAWLAVGRSTLRKQGAAGMVSAARQFVRELDLRKLALRKESAFLELRDEQTEQLVRRFPVRARRNWGAARKVLNIFLRDVVYSHLLRAAHGLSTIEPWLEMPLDSYSFKGLAEDIEVTESWPGVKHLKKPLSDRLQESAREVAHRLGTLRVHLDVRYFQRRNLWSSK